MVSIKEFDDILEALAEQGMYSAQVKPEQANATMLQAYEKSKYLGKELLDFDDVIWGDNIKPIADACRKLGIKEFTISVHQIDILDVLAAFQKLGVSVQCITEIAVHLNRRNWYEDAFLMEVEDAPTPAQLWSKAVDAVYLADEAINKAVLSKQQEENPKEQEQNPETQELKAIQAMCSRLIRVVESEE